MTLINFLNGHNIVSILSVSEIASWLNSTPIPMGVYELRDTNIKTFGTPEIISQINFLKDIEDNQFEYLLLSFSFISQSKWFAIKDVHIWYSDLCKKISSNQDIIVYSLGDTNARRKSVIRLFTGLFIKEINQLGLTKHTMQELFIELAYGFPTALYYLLCLLIASNIITEIEMSRVFIELNSTQRRWESLELSEPPSEADITAIITQHF